MKIVTMFDTGMAYLAKLTITNKALYACNHHYSLAVETNVDPLRPPAWSKILALFENWVDGEMLLWSDIDMFFTNFDIKLEEYDNSSHLIFPTDYGNNKKNRINTSQFLVKCCDLTYKFFQKVWEQEQFINHQWWEQKAIMHCLEQNHQLNISKLPDRQLKSGYKVWERGDFSLHFGGPNKLERMNKWMENNEGYF